MYRSEQLHPRHDTGRFNCGHPALDEWLRDSAATAQAKRLALVWVWCPVDSAVVVGYYTLSAHQITRDELPRKLGRGNPEAIPAVLIGKLALDQGLHGQGLGAALLADALGRILTATERVAARYVVVDAIDEPAANFYQKHGFTRPPFGNRLFLKISSIKASLERLDQP